MFNILNWLFKTQKNENEKIIDNVVPVSKEYKLSDEVINVLDKWNELNNISFTIDDVLKGLNLNYNNFIDISSVNYPIYEDVWKIPGYVGSIRFDLCVSNDNDLNEYSKKIISEAGEHQNVTHIIHFCKDGVVVLMSYKKRVREFRNFKTTYKLNKLSSVCMFDKVKDSSLVVASFDSLLNLITDRIIYNRYQDENGNYIMKVDTYLDDYSGTTIIKFKFVDNASFDLQNEIKFVNKIKSVLSHDFPENTLLNVIKYLKKYNMNIENIDVESKYNSSNISRKVIYRDIGKDKKVCFNKSDVSNQKNDVLKTIDVSTFYENDYYIRTFNVRTYLGNDIVLKIYYNNAYSAMDRDFDIIDYFIGFFPVGLIDKEPEWYSLNIHFMLLSDSCFEKDMECIDKVELTSYSNGKIVDSNKWERYNLVQTQCNETSLVLKKSMKN